MKFPTVCIATTLWPQITPVYGCITILLRKSQVVQLSPARKIDGFRRIRLAAVVLWEVHKGNANYQNLDSRQPAPNIAAA